MSILWPLDSVQITGEFGNSPDFYAQYGQKGHNGIDLGTFQKIGIPVYATDAGTVVAEGWGQTDNWMGQIAGIFVRLGHAWGYSAYAHLSSTVVNVGQWIQRGQLIGYSGATGVGTGPHLHFETFPLFPNFGNGFAGRVNPNIFGLEARGTAPVEPSQPPKENDMSTPIGFENGRKTTQLIQPNVTTVLSFLERHADSPNGNVTVARGPGYVDNYVVNVTLEEGTPGARVNLEFVRETGAGVNSLRRGRNRDEFDSLGMFSKQLVFNGPLSQGQLLRVYVKTQKGSKVAKVTEFYGAGKISS